MMFYSQKRLGSADTILTDDVAIRMAAFSLRENRFDLAAIFNAYIRPPGGMSDLSGCCAGPHRSFCWQRSVGTRILVEHLHNKKNRPRATGSDNAGCF
ncbi:MAG: hypothetical protein CM1200mP41_04910 [Gammaproteobacteria bacterium]|nr:MAG: hypothetical protein CM1200mP41_04910 [Gammaproteobacteria bacterium]